MIIQVLMPIRDIMTMHRGLLSGVLMTFCAASAAFADEINSAKAEELVKNSPCLQGENIDAVLQHKISSSQRDLGWQVFEEDGAYTVERAVLVSKSMQLRYRWKVDGQDAIQPSSERAEKLCMAEE